MSQHCLASFWRQTNIKVSRDCCPLLAFFGACVLHLLCHCAVLCHECHRVPPGAQLPWSNQWLMSTGAAECPIHPPASPHPSTMQGESHHAMSGGSCHAAQYVPFPKLLKNAKITSVEEGTSAEEGTKRGHRQSKGGPVIKGMQRKNTMATLAQPAHDTNTQGGTADPRRLPYRLTSSSLNDCQAECSLLMNSMKHIVPVNFIS